MDRPALRTQFLDLLTLLSTPSKQVAYASNLDRNAGHACAELSAMFADVYHPKDSIFLDTFVESEALELAHLYGVILESRAHECSSIDELLKRPMWRRVMQLSQSLRNSLSSSA